MRHGQALSNAKDIVSSWPEKFENPLTDRGIEAVKDSAKKFEDLPAQAGKKIDLIFASDVLRAKQTAEIAGKLLVIKPKLDKRLREIGFGIYNAGPASKFDKYFKNREERRKKGVPEGESYKDVLERMKSFFQEINRKFNNKNILIVSHQAPLALLEGYVKGHSLLKSVQEFTREKMLRTAELRELN